MTVASNLGFPRIGRRRELKFALEQYWAGTIDGETLLAASAALRATHWRLQVGHGVSHVPSGDFSLYDHVLDTACMLGAIPSGYGWTGGPVSLETYFALARGSRGSAAGVAPGLPALEMTKWFDTNYHYLVPLLSSEQLFSLTANRPLALFREARALSIRTRPVLLGPVSFLLLSKTTDGSAPLDRLEALLPLYAQILRELAEDACPWVQIDEPCLALDLDDTARAAFVRAYDVLANGHGPDVMLTSYFGGFGDNLSTVASLPVAGLHLDVVRAPEQLDAVLAAARSDQWLSIGLIDGRNIWRTDLRSALATLQHIATERGPRHLMVAPSCSLLHVPVDLDQEEKLDRDLQSWLAFATQKLAEITTLARGIEQGETAISAELAASDKALHARRTSTAVHQSAVQARLGAVTSAMSQRPTPHRERRVSQAND